MKRRKVLIVILGLVLLPQFNSSQDIFDFLDNEIVDNFGLTAYGEPCIDECSNRGFSYAWCHKEPSRNGTWIDRDYCSPSPGLTRYGERCLDGCSRKSGQGFFSCPTKVTKRGDWDYCSPFPSDLICEWSQWGPWSECSSQCGTKSTKTRRRRVEQVGSQGRVGRCSGEIEQSIKACQGPPCPDAKPFDCVWGPWTEWTSCSVSCGGGGSQTRRRGISTPPSQDGKPCLDEEATQTILCRRVEECPYDQETTTTVDPMAKTFLGSFNGYFHDVSGDIYAMGDSRLYIEAFRYDGTGPDAFFWVGTRGSEPSEDGILLAHPFRGDFYAYDDPDAPVLRQFSGKTPIVLTLPNGLKVSDLKWISVWCRRFAINFGDLILDLPTTTTTEKQEFTTRKSLIFFQEAPRSIAKPSKETTNKILKSSPSDDGLKLRDKIEEILLNKAPHDPVDRDEGEEENSQPFTVVRVSSSVSQIRPNTQVILDTESDITTEVSNQQETEQPTTTEARLETTTEAETTSKPPKRARPPFLRPIAKFPDIKIPALENIGNNKKKPNNNAVKEETEVVDNDDIEDDVSSEKKSEDDEDKRLKISLFNRPLRPFNAILRNRDRTTTTTTSTTTTTDSTTTTPAPVESTTLVSSLLNQITEDKPTLDPGVANFARIPLTKFTMKDEPKEETTTTTFAPNAVTISAVNNEGFTRILEVVKINRPGDEEIEIEEEPKANINKVEDLENKETIAAVNNEGSTRILEVVKINRPTTEETSIEADEPTESTEDDLENKETIQAVNKSGATRLLEVLKIKRPPGFVPSTEKVKTERPNLVFTRPTPSPTTTSGETEPTLRFTRPKRPLPALPTVSTTTFRPRRPFLTRRTTTSKPQTTIEVTQDTIVDLVPDEVSTEPTLETPEPTPEELERKQDGRANSRFRGLNRISLLFPKRKPFIPTGNRGRSTETPFTTSDEDIILTGFGSRSTERPFTTPTTRPPVTIDGITTTENSLLSLLRGRGRSSRPPFRPRVRTTRAPINILARSSTQAPEVSGSTFTKAPATTPEPVEDTSTIRPSDDERIENMTKLMKDEKKKEDIITQFYPDYEEEKEIEEEQRAISNVKTKFSPKFRLSTSKPDIEDFDDNNFDEPVTPFAPIVLVSTTQSFGSSYDPCDIPESCGPNAICTNNNSNPDCSCPSGFSGIPRDGIPDPSHGCVRTPQKCDTQPCPDNQSCVRDLCLPVCSSDTQCALGERCVNGTCTKICFYDAHCLAGEFCQKEQPDLTNSNGVCLAGCRRDTNCPFGQVCNFADDSKIAGQCENGCHFNNDCTLGTACINGNCTDPCVGFDECGSNAICETVSHTPTCKCPEGTRELNSPYVACVPVDMDLASISCLRDSDCSFGLSCRDWQCRPKK